MKETIFRIVIGCVLSIEPGAIVVASKMSSARYAGHKIPSSDWTMKASFNGISSRVVCAGMALPNEGYSLKYDEEQKTCELGSADLINSDPTENTAVYVQSKPEGVL